MSTPTPSGRVPAFIEARRSIRAFTAEPVAAAVLDRLVEAACLAPAPHHSRPWRFVTVVSAEAKESLAFGMGERWRLDLLADGLDPARADALVVGCLTWDGLDRYPDADRQRAEWGMALLSLGAAVENLMLAAADAGLGSCWVAAPIFCPEEARDALTLDPEWLPHALVLVGHPDPASTPRKRPTVPLGDLRATR